MMVVVVAALSKRIEYLDGPHLRKEAFVMMVGQFGNGGLAYKKE